MSKQFFIGQAVNQQLILFKIKKIIEKPAIIKNVFEKGEINVKATEKEEAHSV